MKRVEDNVCLSPKTIENSAPHQLPRRALASLCQPLIPISCQVTASQSAGPLQVFHPPAGRVAEKKQIQKQENTQKVITKCFNITQKAMCASFWNELYQTLFKLSYTHVSIMPSAFFVSPPPQCLLNLSIRSK